MRLSPGRVQVFGAGYGCRFSRCRCLVLDMAAAWPAWRCWVANNAAGCPWHNSCKSPRTLQKCKLLITRRLAFRAVLGEHKLSSPSTRLKVNRLCIRCLCFGGVRGDLQEGLVYDKRLCGYASRCQFPLFPSTKSRFLCAFAHRDPHFGHKISIFVLGLPLSAASGRVIADIFEILPGEGWHKAPLAVKSSVMIGWIGDKLLD